MSAGETAPSLLCEDAPQFNRDLMSKFQVALENDPAADLLSMFTEQYRYEHLCVRSKKLSEVGRINLMTLDELLGEFDRNPETNLLSAVPRNYTSRITFATVPQYAKNEMPDVAEQLPDFRGKLNHVKSAVEVFPLSENVRSVLARNAKYSGATNMEQQLAENIKQLVWDSPVLWQCHSKGVVVRISDDIVAKVVNGSKNKAEHYSMVYLAENLLDFPAPKSFGMVALGPSFQVIFMSYIPGVTLSEAWPGLSISQKKCIGDEISHVFSRLRTLKINHGEPLGSVAAWEGVKQFRVDQNAQFKGITTNDQFQDLQFSAKHYGSNSYIKFLRSFLNHDRSFSDEKPVFTHGDLRPGNIMVECNPDANDISLKGIIDWEDSGFYPDWYECMALTRTLSVTDENDWYNYLPCSISPSEFPLRWLVHRLWGIHIRTT